MSRVWYLLISSELHVPPKCPLPQYQTTTQMSHIMNGILVKNTLQMLRIHVVRASIQLGIMRGCVMEIFMMIVYKINTGPCKLPISFIDVALHASSIAIDTTKYVGLGSHGLLRIVCSVHLLSRTVIKRVVYVFQYNLREIMHT